MASRVLLSFARAAALAGVVSVALASPSEATRPVRRTTRPTAARGFNLFAGTVNVKMDANRVQCNVNNIGESCVDPGNSSVLGGGFWPKGSPDQYIFNSGLQVAAILTGTKTAAFPWPGDTVGTYFFDATGLQTQGEGRTNVFNALSAADLAAWPTAAYVNDTSLFHSSLIGRQTVSQQDTWVRFWDGNPTSTNGRSHPMGILVEQRGMMWNFPSGNQDIVYFLYRFINITAIDPARYTGLASAGYSATDIADIVAIAQEFQSRNEAAFNIQIPDTGFTWTNMYAAFSQDPDVGQAGQNYSNANLVFSTTMAYKSDFREPTWQFPASIFSAPISAAPGFEGVKYLSSPGNLGISMTGNTGNTGSPFLDPRGVSQLWRYVSGNLLPVDGSCSAPFPATRHFCYWAQIPTDTRFFEASGPFTVRPGQSAVIVVAYVHAGPVGSSPASTPGGSMAPIPAFSLQGFIGGNMLPGLAVDGARLFLGQDTLRNVDRAAGWITQSDVDGDGVIEQCTRDAGPNKWIPPAPLPACVTEVTTTPRSLYNKDLVAQAVFDIRFLLPFAPEIPLFFLVPGDNSVTVVWQPSSTETIGDPFFLIASNPASPLYDPNFRKFDVEGYRVWRGRTQSNLEVIAQFDYAGTLMSDFNASFINAALGSQCAPELGLNGTSPAASCPVVFVAPPAQPTPASPNVKIPLSGAIVQVLPGGRVELAPPGVPNATRGNVLVTTSDTAITGGGSGLTGLSDTGVPFAFTDNTVINGFRYYYSVTAFDINSVKSGPSSLESPLVTKAVTPRGPSGQEVAGTIGAVTFLGAGGAVLDPTAALPTLSATTGIFSGPMPPSGNLVVGFGAFLPQLLTNGAVTVTVDSIVPGSWLVDVRPAVYWFTGQGSGAPVKFSISITGAGTSAPVDISASNSFLATQISTPQSARFGGDSTYALYGSATVRVNGDYRYTNKGRADANADPAGPFNGPRWWTGAANENTNDPNGLTCASPPPVGNSGFSCTLTDLSRNAGAMPGVGIFHITTYTTVASTTPGRNWEGITSTVFRAADFKVFWNATTAGVVDSVVDVTHRLRVPFSTKIRASWGILNDSSFTNTPAASTRDANNARLTWSDVACIDPIPAYLISPTLPCGASPTVVPAFLMNHARLSPVNFASSTFAGTATLAAGAATGTGFIMYLAGTFTMFQVAALPVNTVWNLRTYAGNITGSVGSYGFAAASRPAAVPGLKAQLSYTGSSFNAATTTDASIATVHTVPDPYYVTNSLEITATTKVLRFVNLPAQSIIRIYSSSGILVNVLTHNDVTGGSEQAWNLRNRNNQFVASGVYFFHVESPDGKTKVGRFTVVNFAQ